MCPILADFLHQLQPGDVLLHKSNSLISRAIRKFDGTEVSHAALYLGQETVAEALGDEGLTRRSVEESIKGCEWVEVRRHRCDLATIQPVLEKAQHYLNQGSRYAYEQILLLAFICLTRKLNRSSSICLKLLKAVFDQANWVVRNLRDKQKEPMTCSEFVFRCYDEADPREDDLYSLEISSQALGDPRRGFSSFRRKAGLSFSDLQTLSPNIHPDSIMGQILKQESLSHSSSQTADTLPEAARITTDQLEQLIEEYLAEGAISSTEKLSIAVANAERENLISALFDSARQLMTQLENISRKAIRDINADWVTPGDLYRSPSLKRVTTFPPKNS